MKLCRNDITKLNRAMDDTKREELEKTCKKEKDHKVRIRMVAVRMVRVLNISVEETANLQVRCPTWVRDWLRRYDEGGLEGLRDLPRCGRPRRILRNVMDGIIANVAGCRITPVDLQQYIRAQAGTSLHICTCQEDHAPVQPVPKSGA